MDSIFDIAVAVELTENGSTTLPLVADHATHGGCLYDVLEISMERPPPTRLEED